MSLSAASLVRPWRSLPRIIGIYAAASLAATAAVILINGLVAPPNRTDRLLPLEDVVPLPAGPTPIAASPDLVASAPRGGRSTFGLVFAAVPLELGNGTIEFTPADKSTMFAAFEPTLASSTTLAQRNAGFEGWTMVADGSTADAGADLASFDDRYAKFPNGIDASLAYPTGLYVRPADIPRLSEALQAANAASARAGLFISSSDPSLMKDLRRRLEQK